MDDFYIVENKKQLDYALEVLQDRINAFHMSNGVEIIKPTNTYIEPEVDIARGTIIYPGNTIKGKTIISNDVILKENNVIDNVSIGCNSCISGSVLTNCTIESNVYISPFCEIKDSKIGKETTICGGCHINNYNVKNNQKLEPNTILGREQ